MAIVRLVGDSTALIAINSAKPNPEPWRASGRVPKSSSSPLTAHWEHDQIVKRFVFVVSHYGPRRNDGTSTHRYTVLKMRGLLGGMRGPSLGRELSTGIFTGITI